MSRRRKHTALVGNAADKQQVETAARTERTAAEQAKADLRAVLQTPQGRRVLWRVLGRAHLFESGWSPDTAAVHFAAGERNVGLWLVHEINAADASAFIGMMQDAAQQETHD